MDSPPAGQALDNSEGTTFKLTQQVSMPPNATRTQYRPIEETLDTQCR
ncbi:hypothetical protein [Shewanella sp.]